MLFDSTSLSLTITAKLIEFNDADRAAKFIYDQVEQSLNENLIQDEKSRTFWESVIESLSDFDGEYAVSVAEAYLKLVVNSLKLTKIE
jgi:hypothetical protein